MENLMVENLKTAAALFAASLSSNRVEEIVGITDGKAVGTYVETAFKVYLRQTYFTNDWGNAALGVDLPTINTDIKTTSIKQPQSSLPFKSARQKLYGLGYNLLVFVYEKDDSQECNLIFSSVDFIDAEHTGDYRLSKSVINALDEGQNEDDIFAIFEDMRLPGDEIVYNQLVKEVMHHAPEQGYLTISNALQWRAQYHRIINIAGTVDGVEKIYGK
jgi:hypothetical protein